jgi:hypothetical protein
MTKSTITRTWLAGLWRWRWAWWWPASALTDAWIRGTFTNTGTENGYQFVPSFDSFFWTTVGVDDRGSASWCWAESFSWWRGSEP